MTITKLLKDVLKCEYINKINRKSLKDKCSLNFLLGNKMSQSQCIKMGIILEKLFLEHIERYSTFESIKTKNQKNKHERDHVFICHNTKKIIFAELKANLKLDTEKTKATINKCLFIQNELQSDYIDYDVEWRIVSLRFLYKTDFPPLLQYKYKYYEENVVGINDYLSIFNVETPENYKEYKAYLHYIYDFMN